MRATDSHVRRGGQAGGSGRRGDESDAVRHPTLARRSRWGSPPCTCPCATTSLPSCVQSVVDPPPSSSYAFVIPSFLAMFAALASPKPPVRSSTPLTCSSLAPGTVNARQRPLSSHPTKVRGRADCRRVCPAAEGCGLPTLDHGQAAADGGAQPDSCRGRLVDVHGDRRSQRNASAPSRRCSWRTRSPWCRSRPGRRAWRRSLRRPDGDDRVGAIQHPLGGSCGTRVGRLAVCALRGAPVRRVDVHSTAEDAVPVHATGA